MAPVPAPVPQNNAPATAPAPQHCEKPNEKKGTGRLRCTDYVLGLTVF